MKNRAFVVLGVLFALALLVSSSEPEVQTSHEEKQSHDKGGGEYHVMQGGGGYGYGGRGGGGGGWGGWGGYGGGGYGGPGGGGGWGGGPGGGGGGWGGPGRGWGGGGGGYCRYGCCGWGRYGCRRCCNSLQEAIMFNEYEERP